MSKPEQLRIKVFADKLIIGVIGKEFYKSFSMIDYFGTASNPVGRNHEIAELLDFDPISCYSLTDGLGYPHTQIFRRKK